MGVLGLVGMAKNAPRQRNTRASRSGKTFTCSVCDGDDEEMGGYDLAVCDHCQKAFHRCCHDPALESFGRLDDEQWFCRPCTSLLASSQGLRSHTGDLVWARDTPSALWWPARVLQIDFISLYDPKPFRVQFFLPDRLGGDAWLSPQSLKSWFDIDARKVKDKRIRASMEFAYSAGALPRPANDQTFVLPPATPRKNAESSAASVRSQEPSTSNPSCTPEPVRREERSGVGAQSAAKKQKLECGRALSAFRVRPCPSIVRKTGLMSGREGEACIEGSR